METRRLRLEGTTLAELRARVLAEHGETARIVAADQVTVGGIRGFFAKRHIEATVEVPVTGVARVPGERRRAAHRRDELSTRLSIAALLDEADEAEARLHRDDDRSAGLTGTGTPRSDPGPGARSPRSADPGPGTDPVDRTDARPAPVGAGRAAAARSRESLSTATPDFARLMDELTFATAPVRAAAPGTSAPATSASVATVPAATAPAATAPAATAPVATVPAATVPAATAPAATAPVATAALVAAALATVPGTVPAEPLPEPQPDPRPELPAELTPGAPRLVSGPGDLLLLIGLQADLLEAARALGLDAHAPLVVNIQSVPDRRAALAARARGVEQHRSVLVTCGLPGVAGGGPAPELALLGADQVWALVHAGRKPADTARWVQAASAVVPIDALAVLGSDSTGTPGTVRELGLPIGWLVPASAGPAKPLAIG